MAISDKNTVFSATRLPTPFDGSEDVTVRVAETGEVMAHSESEHFFADGVWSVTVPGHLSGFHGYMASGDSFSSSFTVPV